MRISAWQMNLTIPCAFPPFVSSSHSQINLFLLLTEFLGKYCLRASFVYCQRGCSSPAHFFPWVSVFSLQSLSTLPILEGVCSDTINESLCMLYPRKSCWSGYLITRRTCYVGVGLFLSHLLIVHHFHVNKKHEKTLNILIALPLSIKKSFDP